MTVESIYTDSSFSTSLPSSTSVACSPGWACGYCGGYPAHGPAQCPRVRAVEYYPDGSLKRVEKFEPGEPTTWAPPSLTVPGPVVASPNVCEVAAT
jgi:hypothetical protein